MRDVVIGKLVDRTIDDDYSELSERLFGAGNCFSSSEVRKRMYGMKAMIDAIERDSESAADEDTLAAIDEQRLRLKLDRQKFFDQRTALAKAIREQSRREDFDEIFARCLCSGKLPALPCRKAAVPPSDNDLLVSLNDIHFGASVNNAWRVYNSTVCADMMCRYLDRIIQIAETHRSENCVVWCAGDSISGSIHRSIQVTNRENVIEQITGVSELIAQFVAELSGHFKSVRYVSVAGNHSRLEPNKENALASERLDDLVEWYLAARLQNYENIIIDNSHKLDSTMSMLDVRGKTYMVVHGDYDGSAAKVQALQTMAQRQVYAVLSGHMHHNAADTVQGVKTVMAGSFLGMDDYCVQKRIYGVPEQMVCVCDKDGIRCHYDVTL